MKNPASRLTGSFNRLWMPLMVSCGFVVLVFACLWGYGSWDPMQIDISTATGVAHKVLCCGGVSLLLGTLIFILSREALRDERDKPVDRPVWYFPLMSGLLSLAAMCVAYSFIGMWPFGEKTGMAVDMHHQYAPLLSGLRDAILSGDLSLYNFEVGLGANYLSLAAYYLASPFNLLLLLFPENLLAEGILFITILKNALCGAMFALCVQQIFGKKGFLIPTVSVMYSLMVYLLAYSWNVMWLDVVMILPLVVYGFERLMRTGKFLTYVLSLAYALYANYYLAFMLCIFLALYYLTYTVRARRDSQTLALSFVRFSGYSVLAAGLVACLLIPVYFALKLTSAAGSALPEITNTLDIFQLLGRHLAGTTPTIRSGNLPNMYCGVLAAICVPLFALNKGIPLRRRLAFMMLWLVMAFSFLVNWTDLAWHGLHAPNDLPYRFSFLYSFVLLLMAYQALLHLKEIRMQHVFTVFAGLVAYLLVEERFGGDVYGFEIVYINLALIAVYTVILALVTHGTLRRNIAYALLLLVVTAEMTLNAGYAILTVDANEYFTRHEDYVDNDITEALHAAVEKAQEYGDEKYGAGTYRVEFLPRRTCVDTALFHYQGITTFPSSNYYTTTKLMGAWGYAINGVNSHLYHTFMPFTDSLLGIRYLIAKEEYPSLTKLATVTRGEHTFHIYENPDAMSLGYVVDSSVKDYEYTKYDPITSIEFLYSKLTDVYLPLFYPNSITVDESTGASLGYNGTDFRVNPDGEGAAVINATIDDAGEIFVFVDCMAADNLTVVHGETMKNVTPHEPYLLYMGNMAEGETLTLQIESEQSCSGNFYVVTLNEEAHDAAMDIVGAEQWEITQMSNDHIVGTVDSSLTGTMMTSIPYDAGWTVSVDGKVVETVAIGEGLLAFDVAAGKHTVEMTYYPTGWWIGLGVSGVSILVLAALLIVTAAKKRPKKVRVKAENVRSDSQELTSDAVTVMPVLPESFEELAEQSKKAISPDSDSQAE